MDKTVTNTLCQAVRNMEIRIVNDKETEIMKLTLDHVYTEVGFMEVDHLLAAIPSNTPSIVSQQIDRLILEVQSYFPPFLISMRLLKQCPCYSPKISS